MVEPMAPAVATAAIGAQDALGLPDEVAAGVIQVGKLGKAAMILVAAVAGIFGAGGSWAMAAMNNVDKNDLIAHDQDPLAHTELQAAILSNAQTLKGMTKDKTREKLLAEYQFLHMRWQTKVIECQQSTTNECRRTRRKPKRLDELEVLLITGRGVTP